MASTFSQNLSIELIGTGDQAGTWGTTTNSNLGTLIEQAISGYVTQAVSTGTDTTITIPNGATGVARNMYIELTGTGGASTNLIVPANKKLYFIFNNSTGAVTVKVSGQTGVSVPTGKKMVLVSNGTDIVNGLNFIADFATNSFSVTNLTASSATITNLIATSGSITNLVSSDASATVLRAGSATLTHLSATSASITNLTLTSLVISNLSIASANITTLTGSTQTLSGNLTLNGGTANGVLYLNGSKVVTAGTALVFDGTNLGIGTASPVNRLDVQHTTNGIGMRLRNSSTGVELATRTDATTSGIDAGNASNGMTFSLNTVEGMRLTSTGLGIGTATPGSYLSGTAKLVVLANANSQNSILVRNDNAGSSASCAIALNASGNTWGIESGSTAKNNNALTFQLDYGGANSTKMTLDTSGNLGIGTASPAAKLNVVGGNIRLDNNQGLEWGGANNFIYGNETTDFVVIATNGNERLRVDSSGNLGIGTASPTGKLEVVASATQNAVNIIVPTFDYFGAVIHNQGTSGDNTFMAFGTEAAFTTRGSISYNRAGGLVAYNTTSDYRAKDILGPVQNSGATIDALKVYEGQMKGASQSRPMLVAHEAQEHAPYTVTGEKDAVNEDGTPKYQQMDVSALVPLLLAEVQSLRKRVAELESK